MVHRIGRIVLFSLYVPFVSPVNKFMCTEAMQAQIVGGLKYIATVFYLNFRLN